MIYAAQWIIFFGAAATMVPYVCRLSLLSWRTTRPLIVLMHLALSVSTIWAGYRGWLGDADVGDACAVLGAALWIAISFETWRAGVPEHFTRPAELGEPELQHVGGGSKPCD